MSSIFLSHNHADKSFVNRIAKDLSNIGIRVWIDDAEIKIGDSLIEKIREGIDKVKYFGVVLSKHSIRSEWVKREIDIAMNQEIEDRRVKVLPIKIDDCDLPGFLKGKYYANFQNEDQYNVELGKIINRILSDKSNVSGIWCGHTGLLSLAQHGDDIKGEYQFGTNEFIGDLVGKIIDYKLIFEWKLKNGTEKGVGYFDIENNELLGTYWFQADAPNYLKILSKPTILQETDMSNARGWNLNRK